MTDFVYLAARSADKCFKIGCTSRLEDRIVALEKRYEGFELLHSIETNDARRLESEYHEMFADKRRDGEWFELSSAEISKVVTEKCMFYQHPCPVTRRPTAITRSFRLTDEADSLLKAIANKFGISKTSMLEVIIRERAIDEKVTVTPVTHEDDE